MKRIFLIPKLILSLTLVFVNLISFAQQSGCAKFEPPDGRAIFFIGQDLNATGGFDVHPSNNGYLENVGTAGGVTGYISTYRGVNDAITIYTDEANGGLCLDCYTSTPAFDNYAIAIGWYMVGDLANVANGGRNGHIDALINWCKAQEPRPIFLRIGYEFDTQYECCPEDYKRAWIHIHDRMTNAGVNNVAYVWQAASGLTWPVDVDKLLNWYPGNEYVDWMAYSHFELAQGTFEGAHIMQLARERDKPVMIAEATPRGKRMEQVDADVVFSDNTNDLDNYFGRLFWWIHENEDVIKAFAYINQDWDAQPQWPGNVWGNSRIQDNPELKEKWLAEINKPFWIHGTSPYWDQLGTCSSELRCNAGDDVSVPLPENSITLPGSSVGGGDNHQYSWSQVSGPSQATLVNPDEAHMTAEDLIEGVYVFRLTVTDSENDESTCEVTVNVQDFPQEPWNGTPLVIPGTLQMEEYDTGGEGIAYHDQSGINQGNQHANDFRTEENVDIGATPDEDGYVVGWTEVGDWTEYTVDIQNEGIYNLTMTYSSADGGGSFNLQILGDDHSGTISLPTTGDWQTYSTYQHQTTALPEGEQVIRFQVLTAGFNIDKIEFVHDRVTSSLDKFDNDLVAVYPIPTKEALNIELPSSLNATNIRIYDALGNMIINKEVSGNNFSLNTATLNKGTYLGKIILADSIKTIQFIKE